MSTSDTDKKRQKVYIIVSTCLTVFFLILRFVYESMSFGQYSVFMRAMFLVPLFSGVLPSAILLLTKKENVVSRLSFNLWNAAFSTVLAGCFVRSIINISGRFTDYDKVFWAVSAILLLASVIAELVYIIRIRKAVKSL